MADALLEVGLIGRGAEPLDELDIMLLSDEQRESILRALVDFGTSERIAALDKLKEMIKTAEYDAMLLAARDFDSTPFDEAFGLLALLRAKEVERVGKRP